MIRAPYYVYRLINNDSKIIYIGRTYNIALRLTGHKNTKSWYSEVKRIEYTLAMSEADALVKEIYYINYYDPVYNTKHKTGDGIVLKMKPDTWFPHGCNMDKFFLAKLRENYRYQKEIKELRNRLKEYELKISNTYWCKKVTSLEAEVERYQQQLNSLDLYHENIALKEQLKQYQEKENKQND